MAIFLSLNVSTFAASLRLALIFLAIMSHVAKNQTNKEVKREVDLLHSKYKCLELVYIKLLYAHAQYYRIMNNTIQNKNKRMLSLLLFCQK